MMALTKQKPKLMTSDEYKYALLHRKARTYATQVQIGREYRVHSTPVAEHTAHTYQL